MTDEKLPDCAAAGTPPLNVGEVTELLVRWRRGDDQAADLLLPLVYQQLKQIAAASMRQERAGHTLETSDLLHELYLRLFAGDLHNVQNRGHFLAVAAKVMRRILVDHARAQTARKRLSAGQRKPFSDDLFVPSAKPDHVLAVDEALVALRNRFPRRADLVELRFFGGFSEQEAAEILGVSRSSVSRDWRFSKLWLKHFMSNARAGSD